MRHLLCEFFMLLVPNEYFLVNYVYLISSYIYIVLTCISCGVNILVVGCRWGAGTDFDICDEEGLLRAILHFIDRRGKFTILCTIISFGIQVLLCLGHYRCQHRGSLLIKHVKL